MILCPNCHHEELPGALFCSECGAQLVASDRGATQAFSQVPSGSLIGKQDLPKRGETGSIQTGPLASVALYLVDAGATVQLAGRNEFSLGRAAEGQPILPDVDLSNYEAYSQGVSRLHSSLKIIGSRVVITDLGSSNGTRVNGQKIMPHIDYPLAHGDIISLGKMKIQVLIHK